MAQITNGASGANGPRENWLQPSPATRVPVTPVTTVVAVVTRELERSFTEEELAEAGGPEAAGESVALECARYGLITEKNVDIKVR